MNRVHLSGSCQLKTRKEPPQTVAHRSCTCPSLRVCQVMCRTRPGLGTALNCGQQSAELSPRTGCGGERCRNCRRRCWFFRSRSNSTGGRFGRPSCHDHNRACGAGDRHPRIRRNLGAGDAQSQGPQFIAVIEITGVVVSSVHVRFVCAASRQLRNGAVDAADDASVVPAVVG